MPIARKKNRLPVIGLIISFLFYCAWVYSCFVWVGIRGSNWVAGIEYGALKVLWYPGDGSYYFNWHNTPNFQPGMILGYLFPWATTSLFPPANNGEICFPLWIPVLISAAGTMLLWVLFRQAEVRRLLQWVGLTLSITIVLLILYHVVLWPTGFFRRAASAWAGWSYSSLVFVTPWLAAIASTMWIRRNLPKSPGHCSTCGYDLTGNMSGVCPECGVQIAEKAPSTSP
jgi:hypothetical protein